jgi:hypothetical protein
MIKNIIIFSFVFFGLLSFAKAQNIGINTTGTPPHPSAGLDVDFNNKGLLIPRVAITSYTDVTTIPSPTTSLLIYNTGTGGFSPAGFYYWDGTQWVRLITNTSSGGSSNSHCFTCDGF